MVVFVKDKFKSPPERRHPLTNRAPKKLPPHKALFWNPKVFAKLSSFKKPVCGAATFFVAKSCIKTELFKSAPFCCMFLTTFLEKSLKVAQNGENHSQISPQKSCRLTKHFFEIPRSLSSRPLSKNPFVGRQLFSWPNPVLKQNFFIQPRFAVCFWPLF